jgi:DNA-binding response OmpR family regulator
VRAEVSHPIRSAPLRRAAIAGGRQLWLCQAGSGAAKRKQTAGSSDTGASIGNESRRILVVDDERSMRMLCRVNLNVSGMEVLEADDGKAGLELARREHPDLILLDVMMPGLDGWGVARELASDESTKEIPVIFLTARAEAADRRLGEQLGGVGYLVKPFDPVGIGEFVEDVLARIQRGEREQLQRGIATEHEP